MSRTDMDHWSRRDVLAVTGTGLVVAAGVAALPRAALATEAEVDKLAAEKTAGVAPKDGKITLDVPELAENGATVQFIVSVDSPMTDKDHVKAIHLFTEGNPFPQAASYFFTPMSGKASVTGRIRLATSQKVRAIAVMSDGSTYVARKDVKVTVGGCGG